MRFFGITIILVFSLLLLSCDTTNDPQPGDVLYLRVKNDTDSNITVVVQPSENIDENSQLTVDFGSIESGVTTGYREVNAQFYVSVNGEPFGYGGELTFGIDSNPSRNWTLTIHSLIGGWSLQADFN